MWWRNHFRWQLVTSWSHVNRRHASLSVLPLPGSLPIEMVRKCRRCHRIRMPAFGGWLWPRPGPRSFPCGHYWHRFRVHDARVSHRLVDSLPGVMSGIAPAPCLRHLAQVLQPSVMLVGLREVIHHDHVDILLTIHVCLDNGTHQPGVDASAFVLVRCSVASPKLHCQSKKNSHL